MIRAIRCSFGLVLAVVALSTGAAESQESARLPRIGWLTLEGKTGPRQEAFRRGLRELGYRDGQTIIIEHRVAEGRVERLPALAAELVGLKVDILVALSPPAARAAKDATKSIPIVMRSTDDPVKLGWVESLARPGGNITGVTSYARLLTGKRMELLLEAIPKLSRIAVLWKPGGPNADRNFRQVQAAARELRVELLSLEVQSTRDLERAFEVAAREHAGALITIRTPLLVIHRSRVAQLAEMSKIPAMYDDRQFVEAGGLMSYGANLAELYRRAAFYVDKILSGTPPAEMPVEQPRHFELYINLKTASEIGFTFPPELLLRADKIIR